MGHRCGCHVPLYITLQQAHSWLPAPVPQLVLKEFRPHALGGLIDLLIADASLPNGSALRLVAIPQVSALRAFATLAAAPVSWIRYKYDVPKCRSVIPAYLVHYRLQASRIVDTASGTLKGSHGTARKQVVDMGAGVGKRIG